MKSFNTDPSDGPSASAPKAGQDSARTVKEAFAGISGWIKENFKDFEIALNNKKLIVTLRQGQHAINVAIRSGCSVLGHRTVSGDWDILPDVDLVLYAPDAAARQNRFRVFTREQFLDLWTTLGLIRYKVSSAQRKRVFNRMGATEIINSDEYADVISIQSYTNSDIKSKAVFAALEDLPLLSENVLRSIVAK